MKKAILSIILMLLPMLASADAVEIDGICYILIEKGKVAEVTRNFNRSYSGNVIIPPKVSYEGTDYDVTSISGNVSNNGNTYLGGAFRGCTGLTGSIPSELFIGDEEEFALSYHLLVIIPAKTVIDCVVE